MKRAADVSVERGGAGKGRAKCKTRNLQVYVRSKRYGDNQTATEENHRAGEDKEAARLMVAYSSDCQVEET